jgi:hypothetical protein
MRPLGLLLGPTILLVLYNKRCTLKASLIPASANGMLPGVARCLVKYCISFQWLLTLRVHPSLSLQPHNVQYLHIRYRVGSTHRVAL